MDVFCLKIFCYTIKNLVIIHRYRHQYKPRRLILLQYKYMKSNQFKIKQKAITFSEKTPSAKSEAFNCIKFAFLQSVKKVALCRVVYRTRHFSHCCYFHHPGHHDAQFACNGSSNLMESNARWFQAIFHWDIWPNFCISRNKRKVGCPIIYTDTIHYAILFIETQQYNFPQMIYFTEFSVWWQNPKVLYKYITSSHIIQELSKSAFSGGWWWSRPTQPKVPRSVQICNFRGGGRGWWSRPTFLKYLSGVLKEFWAQILPCHILEPLHRR